MNTILKALLGISFLIIATCQAEETDVLEEWKWREHRISEAAQAAMPAVVALGNFGTGVVVSQEGYVLTAAHNLLVNGDDMMVELTFTDGRQARAKKLGADLANDVGLLSLLEPGPWPHVKIVTKPNLKPGDWCIALGYPGGRGKYRSTPSLRLGRLLEVVENRFVTDCAVYSGDSGGPLISLDGEFIGIHSSCAESLAENDHITGLASLTNWNRLVRGDRWGELPGRKRRDSWDEDSTRKRVVTELERQHPAVLQQFASLGRNIRESIVSIEGDDGAPIALGTIVDRAGGLVTKASELQGRKIVTCRSSTGGVGSAQLILCSDEHDLAYLRLSEEKEVQPVRWVSSDCKVGTIVVTFKPSGTAACMGIVSCPPFSAETWFKLGVPGWFRKDMIRLGAVPSQRLTGFPRVFQHDTPLYPEYCGGPLVNLNGETVAINIARFGRVDSFAIPGRIVQEFVLQASKSRNSVEEQ